MVKSVATNRLAVDPLAASPLTPLGDAAVFNASFDWNTGAIPHHIEDYVGETLRGKPVLPHGENVPGTVTWQLDTSLKQDTSDGIITFGFATWNHGVGVSNNPQKFGQGQGYTPFTAEQQAAARIAIQNWDDLISAKFVEVDMGPGASGFGKNSADIVLANSYTGPAQAEAYYPGLTPYYGKVYQRVQGDVWVADPRYNGSNLQLEPGQYGLQTLNHELGHTLGLSHPGSYNFGDDQDGDGLPDPINYTGDAQYFQDSHQYTIMSYFDSYETGAQNIDWNVMRFVYPSTPMVDDVFVIQQKYGADMTTRAGDTVYGFNATADVTNEAMRFHAGEMATIFTIWDGGGNDTLDLSGYYTNSTIDLREGAYSSAGGWGAYDPTLIGTAPTLAQINLNNTAAGFGPRTARLYDIYFKDGYSEGGVLINEGISWKNITGTGDDYLMGQNIGIAYGAIIENGIGGHGNDVIVGNQAGNHLIGNDGNDKLYGLDGDDVLNGGRGADTLTGGEGHDLFVFDHFETGDVITDFGGDDRIDLSALGDNLSYTGQSAFTGTAGQVIYADGVLSLDTNGDMIADFSVILSGMPGLQTDQLALVA